MKLVFPLFFVFMSGCAVRGIDDIMTGPPALDPEPNYQEVVNLWVGKTETKLVTVLGPPTSVYKLDDGSKFLTYESNYGTTGASSYIGNGLAVGSNRPNWCKTSFLVSKASIVTSVKTEGNRCD